MRRFMAGFVTGAVVLFLALDQAGKVFKRATIRRAQQESQAAQVREAAIQAHQAAQAAKKEEPHAKKEAPHDPRLN